ncbi:hypothetical protein BGX20_003756 [Mortierella sp. AD010]|nr:hypothetical protein BGX20_003756 [Mortierella sp. AD010]
MDTPTHSLPLPQLQQNGKKLSSLDSLPSSNPKCSSSHSHPHLSHHSHNNNPKNCLDVGPSHQNTSAQGNTHNHNYINRMRRSFSNARPLGSGLSLREQQQIRNQQAFMNSINNSTDNSLSLSITPPKFMTTYLPVDSQDQARLYNTNGYSTQQQSLQNGGNNSLPLPSTHTPRRASFSLSTGSLNFNSSTSPSMGSPSSPSYSTIAVARARAAATAAAAEAGEGGGQGVDAVGDQLGIIGSGVFPGASGVVGGQQDPFSSPPSSSRSQDLSFNSRQSHPPLSDSLTSSSESSLLSDASVSSAGSGSGSGPPSSSSSSTSVSVAATQSHLQNNADAEREISMILDNFLYLGGDLVEEEQVLELERLGIKRVLNMAINCDDLLWIERTGKDNGSYLKVGLLDHVDQDLKAASSTSPVYVHCQAGKSRSVATVIGYLIQEHKWPFKKAYDHVVERRRIMSPNIGFVSQLVMLEERVLGPNKAGGLAD